MVQPLGNRCVLGVILQALKHHYPIDKLSGITCSEGTPSRSGSIHVATTRHVNKSRHSQTRLLRRSYRRSIGVGVVIGIRLRYTS
jgi:hypothetical protein